MSHQPIVRLEHVTKTFQSWDQHPESIKRLLVNAMKGKVSRGTLYKRTVLEDVSFSISPGEFVGVMGRNGAGKSTIMKLIAGIYKPNSGSVFVGGKVAPLLELGAGFVPDLSGTENIFLNASILGYRRQEIQETLKKIVDFSELGEHINRPVKRYSSGMLIRLGFSIAAHLDAPILLFDEVLAVGDVGFQNKCLSKIDELHTAGRAIILITHSPEQIRQHCDRCIMIEGSRVVYDGEPVEGTNSYMNLFANSVDPSRQ